MAPEVEETTEVVQGIDPDPCMIEETIETTDMTEMTIIKRILTEDTDKRVLIEVIVVIEMIAEKTDMIQERCFHHPKRFQRISAEVPIEGTMGQDLAMMKDHHIKVTTPTDL